MGKSYEFHMYENVDTLSSRWIVRATAWKLRWTGGKRFSDGSKNIYPEFPDIFIRELKGSLSYLFNISIANPRFQSNLNENILTSLGGHI